MRQQPAVPHRHGVGGQAWPSRRQVVKGALSAGIGSVLAACGTGRRLDDPQPVGGRFDDVTVRISAIADQYVCGFRFYERELAERLGLHMRFDVTPPTNAYVKDMLAFQAGRTDSDIVLFQPANLADYSRHLHAVSDLEKRHGLDYRLDDVVEVYRDVYTTWGGTPYSIPWDGDQHNLYYNLPAFAREENRAAFQAAYGYELAPPTTWAEYRDVAEFMTGFDWTGDGRTTYGVAEAWQRGGYAFWWWTNRFASYGGVWFDDQMRPLIDTPSGVKALEQLLAMVPFVPPGAANYGQPEVQAALLTETVPMVIGWSSIGKAAMDPSASRIVGKVGVSMVPGVEPPDGGDVHRRPALPTGWTAGIPRYSDRVTAAAHLLHYVSHPDRALRIGLDAGTSVDPWRQSSFAATSRWEGLWGPDARSYAATYLDTLRSTLDQGFADLQIPGSFEYVTVADSAIGAAVAGQQSAETALRGAAETWDRITDRLGRERQRQAWRRQFAAMSRAGISYRPELAR